MVKFHRTIIINGELANRDKIFNKIGRNQNIIKMKLMWKNSGASEGDEKFPLPTIIEEGQ